MKGDITISTTANKTYKYWLEQIGQRLDWNKISYRTIFVLSGYTYTLAYFAKNSQIIFTYSAVKGNGQFSIVQIVISSTCLYRYSYQLNSTTSFSDETDNTCPANYTFKLIY